MENGALIIHETNVSSTNAITIQSPVAVASAYSLTLPAALPASTKSYMASSTGGTLTLNTPDTLASEMTATGANAIRTVSTRTTGTTVAAGGVAISADASGTNSTNSYTDVAGMTVTITTSGRPVYIGLIAPTAGAGTGGIASASSSCNPYLKLKRDSTDIGEYQTANGGSTLSVPIGGCNFIDAVAAGTYVYKIQLKNGSGAGGLASVLGRLIAYEL